MPTLRTRLRAGVVPRALAVTLAAAAAVLGFSTSVASTSAATAGTRQPVAAAAAWTPQPWGVDWAVTLHPRAGSWTVYPQNFVMSQTGMDLGFYNGKSHGWGHLEVKAVSCGGTWQGPVTDSPSLSFRLVALDFGAGSCLRLAYRAVSVGHEVPVPGIVYYNTHLIGPPVN